MQPPPQPPRIIRYIVDHKDGIVESPDRQSDTSFTRERSETESDFKARVTQAVETMESRAIERST
jgi:hypothetical protein